MSLDLYIKDLTEFDYLMNEEMFALRRNFGFYWFGRSEIIEQTNKHLILKKQMFLYLKNTYNLKYKVLEEYLKSDILNRNYNLLANLSDSDKNILQKYKISFDTYRKSFEKNYGSIPKLEFVSNEFKKIINTFENKPIVLDYFNIRDCAICMNSEKNINCITDCNHQFHKICIDEWNKINNSCPVCRNNNPFISKISLESNC
jgi:hypothetical protein